MNKLEILAIIQARGGSKGIPRKNLYPLAGHPLIAYSIESALNSRYISRIIVSTDDDKIAKTAREYGAETPFERPVELATDSAVDYPLFMHALDWLFKNEQYKPDVIVQLRPTSPLRPSGLLDRAISVLFDKPDADCVRGVTVPRQNPYKMWRINNNEGTLEPLIKSDFIEPYNMPRQFLPVTYWQTGHVDVVRYDTISKKKSLSGDKIYPVLIDQEYCVDIDTEKDLQYAEWLIMNKYISIDMPYFKD